MSAKRVSLGCRDLISSLPDEVLGKILSLLPTKLAVSTSILSNRWSNLLTLVDNLDFNDASRDPRGFSDFVDKTLALTNSSIIKRFSLKCKHQHEKSRVGSWIGTVLERGFLELHLETVCTHWGMHIIETKFFTSNTLVKLTLSNGFRPSRFLPPGGVFFPALKTLSLISAGYLYKEIYALLISGCPVLEELVLHHGDPLAWNAVASGHSLAVSSPSIKRLTISYHFPDNQAPNSAWFRAPSLVYLDYSSYVTKQYVVDLGSLVEARLDLRSPKKRFLVVDEDVTDLVAGISNVKTLHLSPNSLEVFHLFCKSMPVFHNLLTLSFESDKERGWEVVPLLLNNSPNLETLVIKGLLHQVTDRCGDACVCIPQKKKKKKMEEDVCCLSTCHVKVLNISGYRGTHRELKQMRHFLGNLKCLETVNVGVVEAENHRKDNQRIINALMRLPTVSSKCQIHFF